MAKPARKTVGVIGLGNMGGGIARNLAEAGHDVLAWDVSEAARNRLKNKAEMAEPASMAARASVIFFVVPGSAEIDALLKGRSGMLAKARRGLVLYDFTTSDPAATRKLSRKAKAKGIPYLDAGMTGGASGADAGTLKLMLGGDKRAFSRTRPVLEAFTTQLYHLGPSGAGHTMKILFNMVVHTNFLVVCEAALAAEKAGIPLADAIQVINAGNARNFASERRFPDHILSGTWDGRSRVYNLNKDVGMAVALARKMGLPVSIGASTSGYLKKAIRAGMADEDFTRLYQRLAKL